MGIDGPHELPPGGRHAQVHRRLAEELPAGPGLAVNEWKEIKRRAKRAGDSDIPTLFLEVFGASYAGQVTTERARESILEACAEMLERSQPGTRRTTMEAILKDILAEAQKTNELLLRLINGSGETKPAKVKAPKITEEFKPVVQPDGTTKLVEQTPEITPEVLRAVASVYAKKFGMEDLLKLNVKFGAKKLTDILPANRAALMTEMQGRIDREGQIDREPTNRAAAAAEAPKPTVLVKVITLDELKVMGGKFLKKHGEIKLGELLKAFGVAKLSAVPSDKYPALAEAFTNA
jgi:hypothetical protein